MDWKEGPAESIPPWDGHSCPPWSDRNVRPTHGLPRWSISVPGAKETVPDVFLEADLQAILDTISVKNP